MDPAIAAIIGATISAGGFVLVALISTRTSRKVDAVQVLVDGRMTQALDKIESLEAKIEGLGGQVAPATRAEIEEEKP